MTIKQRLHRRVEIFYAIHGVLPPSIPVTRKEYHELEMALKATCACGDDYRRRKSPLVHTIGFRNIKVEINESLAQRLTGSDIIDIVN